MTNKRELEVIIEEVGIDEVLELIGNICYDFAACKSLQYAENWWRIGNEVYAAANTGLVTR